MFDVAGDSSGVLSQYGIQEPLIIGNIFKKIIWQNTCISYCIAFQTILLTATIATSLH